MITGKPNLLLLMSDEHNPRFSEPYGHPFVRTPHLQRLAAEGVTFDAAYCPAPLCVPSRMAFMSGRFPYRVGGYDNGCSLPSNVPTWAHRLGSVGYETALAGKMHFIGPDQQHGFQHVLHPEINQNTFIHRACDWTRPIPATAAGLGDRLRRAGPGETPYLQYDRDVERAATAFLADTARRDRPWALCASFIAPHFPLIAPPDLFDLYYPEHADLPYEPVPQIPEHPHRQRVRLLFDLSDVDDEVVRRARAAYYALCTFVDQRVGRVLAALDSNGLAENTVVLYTSDHGELLGEQGLWWKNVFDEEAVRIPLIVRSPRGVSQRVRVSVSLLDVTATLVDLAEAPAAGLDGCSLSPFLEGHVPPDWPGEVLVEYEGHAAVAPQRMLRWGDWKLCYYHGEPGELFHLATDPRELRDRWDDPSCAFIRDRMLQRLFADWDPRTIDDAVRSSQYQRSLLGKRGLAGDGT